MKIDEERGMWLNDTLEGHGYDLELSNAICDFFIDKKASTVVDLGCGHASYAKKLVSAGIECDAFDGNPYTPKLTNNFAKVLDLSQIQESHKLYDYVLCLEVGEHISNKYEKNVITNIHNFNKKGIVLSWAIVGQGGDGHINCKNNDEIIKIFNNLGYIYNFEDSQKLRNKSYFSWFKNTIMVFEK